jgi:hypothetical protein
MVKQRQPESVVVYQLKVRLTDIESPIWRRFLVAGDQTLYRLHLILQAIMGWENYHLYEFFIDEIEYGEPDDEYQPDIAYARKTMMSQVLHSQGQRFRYVYDYGDNWEHEIEVEKISEPKEYAFYPVCLEGERACPPEDCGGVTGYDELLDALGDSEHTEHGHMVLWSEGFNSETFDCFAINRELRRYAQHWPMSYSVSLRTSHQPLPAVNSINRCVAVIRPRKPFFEWLQSLPDWDSHIMLKDIRSNCMSILIPEVDSNEEALDYVEDNYHLFFEIQLHNWHRDNRLWPEKRTLTKFRSWFKVELHSLVHDVLYEELYREWPIRTRNFLRNDSHR